MASAGDADNGNAKQFSNVLIYMAMEAEAGPLLKFLELKKQPGDIFPPGSPWQLSSGEYRGMTINLVTPGKCETHGVDNVGTVAAAVAVYAAEVALKPDLVINAGTAGGFKSRGAAIGDVYIASHSLHHDRRIPIPGFKEYGVGIKELTLGPKIAAALGLKIGRVSSGNSLDMTDSDKDIMNEHEANVKDMEAAAIAWVAGLAKVPFVAVKSVTDIVDGDKPTQEEFLENLSTAAHSLQDAVPKVLGAVADGALIEA